MNYLLVPNSSLLLPRSSLLIPNPAAGMEADTPQRRREILMREECGGYNITARTPLLPVAAARSMSGQPDGAGRDAKFCGWGE